MSSPHVFFFSGDFTLSCILVLRIARTFIEEIGYNSPKLINIIRKIDDLMGGPQEERVEKS